MKGTPATVCQLVYTLEMGGVEVLASRIARGLGGAYRFVFACLDELGVLGEGLRDEGFPVRLLGRRPGVDLSCMRRLAGLLRDERVDLIHAYTYGPFFYGAMARLRRGRPPILYAEHARLFPDRPRLRRVVASRLLLRPSDRVVAVSRSARRALIDNEKIPAARIEVIDNGIDLTEFSGQLPGRAAVRAQLAVGRDDLLIIQVARLSPIKDHATAIRALKIAARRIGAMRLALVGDGSESEVLRRLIVQEGMESRVRFLGLRTDVPRLLAAADIFLLSSLSEAAPLSVMEAMAAGLPVVATRVGGVDELVVDGLTGLLAPAGDPTALAEAMIRLVESPGLMERMGRAGRERAHATFSEARMHGRYRTIYNEMLGHRAPCTGLQLLRGTRNPSS